MMWYLMSLIKSAIKIPELVKKYSKKYSKKTCDLYVMGLFWKNQALNRVYIVRNSTKLYNIV